MTLKKTTMMILTIAISTMISLAIILIACAFIVTFFVYVIGKYLSSVQVIRKPIKSRIEETVEEVPGMTVDANGLADMKMLAWFKDLKFVLNHTNCNNDLMYCSASIAEFEAAFMYMPGAKDLLNELINTYDAIKNKVVE